MSLSEEPNILTQILKKSIHCLKLNTYHPSSTPPVLASEIVNKDLLLDVPSSDIANLGQIVGNKNFLTTDVLDRIHRIYKIDYDFFDYERALG